jgi:hypothetical protein
MPRCSYQQLLQADCFLQPLHGMHQLPNYHLLQYFCDVEERSANPNTHQLQIRRRGHGGYQHTASTALSPSSLYNIVQQSVVASNPAGN